MLETAEIIRTALTPVFLLAAMAGFLNVLVGRLARVADRVNILSEALALTDNPDALRLHRLFFLRRRTLALETAVVFATTSGVLTCLAILGLLIPTSWDENRERTLLWLFGGAVVALICAFASFLIEMIAAGTSLLRQIAEDRRLLKHRLGQLDLRIPARPETGGAP